MLAIDANPPLKPPAFETLEQLPGTWWVAHTKARCEKAFAWDLHHRDIGYFLPMIQQTTFSGGRKRRNLAVLFPSYVFFCGAPEDRIRALGTNRICQIIEVHDQKKLKMELSAIERVLQHSTGLEAHPFAEVGRTCRVARGPLQGLEGVITQCCRNTRLHLQVSALGQSVALEIDADLLERVA